MSGASAAVGAWWRSLRAFSFPASIVPAALAATIVIGHGLSATWWTFPLFGLAAVLFHAGTNVLNDYYDHRHGVDGPDDPDPTHAISRGVVPPRFMAVSGHVYFVVAIALGCVIATVRGPVFLAVGLAGAIGGYLYTSRRISLKYVALGDVAVFVLMGPLLVAIGVWALHGSVPTHVYAESLPIAFLVTAILHANNLRDIDGDRAAGITTVAGLLGEGGSRRLFVVLVVAPYITVAALVVSGTIGLPVLAVAVTLPLALRPVKRVVRRRSDDRLIDLPVQCAMLHLAFGALYVGSMGIA